MNDDTNKRLNRELARMRLRDAGFWGGLALLVAVVVLYGLLALNTITNTRYVTGIAGETTPLMNDDGIRLTTRVTVEGQIRDIRMPSQLVHPAKGDTLCLRAGEHRFTGHTSYVSVSRTLCDGPSATQQVD